MEIIDKISIDQVTETIDTTTATKRTKTHKTTITKAIGTVTKNTTDYVTSIPDLIWNNRNNGNNNNRYNNKYNDKNSNN